MASACTTVWEKAAPLALVLKQYNSILPICSWCFSSCCPSLSTRTVLTREWVPVSPCVSPLKGMPGIPEALCLSQTWSLLVFITRSYGTSLSDTGTLGWGAWCRAGPPRSSGENSAAEISLQIFNCHTWVWDQPVLHLCSSYQSRGFFCISLVIRLLFTQTLCGFQWWFFCTLVVILMWSWEDASTPFIYSAILTTSSF